MLRRVNYFSLFLLVASLLCALIYLKTLNYPFIYDDFGYVQANQEIRDLHNFWPPYGTRYLGYLSFGINYLTTGLNVAAFRLTNILIHFVNSIAVYILLSLILKTPALNFSGNKKEIPSIIPFSAALIFLVHPIQTQAVIYIAQRFTSLATFFYLSALILFLKWKLSDRKIFYFIAFFVVLLAQKTKEISFTLPFMIALVDFTFYRMEFKKRLYLIPFLFTLVIIPLEVFVSDSLLAQDQKIDLTTLSPYSYLITEFLVILMYLRLLFVPVNQTLIYDMPLFESFRSPQVLASFIVLIIILGLAGHLYFNALKSNSPKILLASFGILFFFLAISVESSFIPIKDVAFEHRLYLPSIGIILFSSVLIACVNQKRYYVSSVLILLVFAIAPLSYASYKRSFAWSSEEAMWQDNVVKAPKSPNAHYNLALVYHQKDLDKAIYHYNQALLNKPDYYMARQNLGIALVQKGEIYEGIKHLEEAIKQFENYKACHALGEAYNQIGDYRSAAFYHMRSIELNPGYGPGHFDLAKVLTRAGKAHYAIKHFMKAIELNYNTGEAMQELSNLRGW